LHPDLLAGLRPARQGGGDVLAVQRRHLERPTQGRLAEGDRYLAVQLLVVPHEQRVLPHLDDAGQVARPGARPAGPALAGPADAHPLIDAGRHLHGQRLLDLHGPGAATAAAGVGDDRAPTAADATGLLDAEEPLPLDDHAVAVAAPAGLRLGAGPA